MKVIQSRVGRAAVAAVVGISSAAGVSAVIHGAHAASSVTVNRLAGNDRYQTSATIAETKYPSGVPSGNVVLATGLNFPDALAGNYLAGQLGAPILLTTQTTSDPAYSTVTAALAKLLPGTTKKVTILGGTSAVGSDVQTDLTSKGYTVTRIGGNTRYDTAQMVDTQSGQTPGNGKSGNPTAFIATGLNYPDALAAGPVAWNKKFPIVLTDGSQSSLSPQAQATLTADKIKNVLIMGGSAAINAGINSSLQSMGITIDKQFAGQDRTDTAAQLAAYAQSTYAFGTASVILASGQSFADALSAGPLGGDTQDIYLGATSDSLGSFTASAFQALAGKAGTLNIVGGTSVIDTNEQNQASTDLQQATNSTYTVSPSAGQTINTSAASPGSAQFTVTNAGTAPVDIALFNCNNVQNNGGTYTFTGTNSGGSGNNAVPGTVTNESITVVNGNTVTAATQINTVTPSSGSVTFTVKNNGTAGECVTPVIFADTSGHHMALSSTNSPTGPFGVGAQTTFSMPAAAGSFGGGAGSTAPTDAVTGYTSSTFTTANGTYTYGSGDTYQIFGSNGVTSSCASSTLGAFQSALSKGDKVGGNYQPGSTSTFCLNDIAPLPPSSVTATKNTSAGGVTVAFNDSATPDVASYNVYRATASNNGITGAPLTCASAPGGGSGVSPQTAPSTSTSWTKIGSVPDADVGTASSNNYTFNDPTSAPASGTVPQYCYLVSSVGPSANGTQESTGTPAATNSGGGVAPAPAPVAGAPAFASATVQGQTLVLTYTTAINPATVDKGDFHVSWGTSNTGGGTQQTDTPDSASGSGSTVTVELPTAVPTGDFALVAAQLGSDTTPNTVCASGSTTSCEAVGDQVITTAATAAGTAPTMVLAGSKTTSTTTILVQLTSAIDCATVDNDWTVSDMSNPAIGTLDSVSAKCANSGGTALTISPGQFTTSQYVLLTVSPLPLSTSTGNKITVTAQKGTDGDSVIDPATGAQEPFSPTADTITITEP